MQVTKYITPSGHYDITLETTEKEMRSIHYVTVEGPQLYRSVGALLRQGEIKMILRATRAHYCGHTIELAPAEIKPTMTADEILELFIGRYMDLLALVQLAQSSTGISRIVSL